MGKHQSTYPVWVESQLQWNWAIFYCIREGREYSVWSPYMRRTQ